MATSSNPKGDVERLAGILKEFQPEDVATAVRDLGLTVSPPFYLDRVAALEERMSLLAPATVAAVKEAPPLALAACKCIVELDKEQPISVAGQLINSKGKPVGHTYTPKLAKEPKCEGPGCVGEPEVTYSWTLREISKKKKYHLWHRDQAKKTCEVYYDGQFELCLKVTVVCYERAQFETVTIVRRCEDTGCVEFRHAGLSDE